jgi:hypothetical protein
MKSPERAKSSAVIARTRADHRSVYEMLIEFGTEAHTLHSGLTTDNGAARETAPIGEKNLCLFM